MGKTSELWFADVYRVNPVDCSQRLIDWKQHKQPHLVPKSNPFKSHATLRTVFRQLLAQVTCEKSTNALNANAHQASDNPVHLFSLSLSHTHTPFNISGLIVCPIILGPIESQPQSNKRRLMNCVSPNWGSASQIGK